MLTAPAAAVAARISRRVGDNDIADMMASSGVLVFSRFASFVTAGGSGRRREQASLNL
jgi:hypothetical protein